MAKPDEKKALLEDFAEACTEAAQGLAPADRHLDWEHGKEGLVHFHCPQTGARQAHAWNGAPRASAWMVGNDVKATCGKCVGAEADYPDHASYKAAQDAYTDKVKRAIRWEQDGVVHTNFDTEVIREHFYFDRDFTECVRRQKYRYLDARKEKGNRFPWRWASAPLTDGQVSGMYMRTTAATWLPKHYPECETIYEALCWYGLQMIIEPGAGQPSASTAALRDCKVVICEGEKDCDTFNELMAAAGVDGWFATCLSHPDPNKLASHHLRLVNGRDVVVVGDKDEAGRQHAENWTRLLWQHIKSVKLVREQFDLDGTPEDKDLTDWVTKRGGTRYPNVAKVIAAELLDIFAATPPLMEPIGKVDDWKHGFVPTAKGGVKADSPYNCKKVWTQHPALKGRLRTNLHSGEVEVVGPPWAPASTVVGARAAAIDCATWLEETEKLSLSTKVLEDTVRQATISPVANVVPQPGAWDGQPAIGRMTVDVPLDAAPDQVLRLWEIFYRDLARKVAGERHAQRCVIGVATDRNIDLARAIMGDHGAVHGGSVNEAHLLDYARRGIVLVQVDMSVIADQRRALNSAANLFQPDVWSRTVQRALPTPLFLAVGHWPGSLDRRDRCLPLKLAGDVLLDALAIDGQAALAEAAARQDLDEVTVPSQGSILTVDEAERRESCKAMLWALYNFATKELDLRHVADPASIGGTHLRPTPLRYIHRDQFFAVMRAVLIDSWRTSDALIGSFNAACRSMGWREQLSVTPAIVAQLDLVLDFGGRKSMTVGGTLLNDERLRELRDHLGSPLDLPPMGGGLTLVASPDGCDRCEPVAPPEKARDSASCAVAYEVLVRKEEQSKIDSDATRARPHDILKTTRGATRRWLDGVEAVATVQAILARPGWCAIDFETSPTSPAWHGDEASRTAPRGTKGRARQEMVLWATMQGRARHRTACTLQVHHECGDEAFVRLTKPHDELPAMFEGRRAGLVAHNAQFEVEVLAKHGVPADVECTWLAARALYLTARPDDQPQPHELSLAALAERELGRPRDKTVRDRDWSLESSLDDEAVEYGLQDARDCLELWRLYEPMLDVAGLFDGYRELQRALLPTAVVNISGGLVLDEEAHKSLMHRLAQDAAVAKARLDQLCGNAIENHGSDQQVGTWIMETVLDTPIKPPVEPKVVDLVQFLSKVGLAPDPGGEVKELRIPGLMKLTGRSLEDATIAAWEAGYIGHGHNRDQMDADAGRPEERDLLRELDRSRTGRVLTIDDQVRWDAYAEAKAAFDERYKPDPHRASNFDIRLRAKTGIGWRVTATGQLNLRSGTKRRKAEQLAAAFPRVADYLLAHNSWRKDAKLLEAFGPTLRQWVDDDHFVRGQYRVSGATTGRHSCRDPNLQNQPATTEFRALWVARPGRKLVIADYSQIELRLLAIVADDERLREVYREGRDVHQETADIAGIERGRTAKGINFGLAYGSGAAGLSENLGISLDEAHRLMHSVLGAYQGLARFRQVAPDLARARGYIEIRPDRRILFDADSPGTCAINYPIQGGAASVQMRALRYAHDALRARPDLDAFVAASIHDEFLVDAPEGDRADEAGRVLVECMARALVELYPEAGDMGVARLASPKVCDRWSEKD